MNFYNELLKLDNKDIDTLVDYRIEYLERNKERSYIGYNAENNFINHKVEIKNNERAYSLEVRCFHSGFIPKDTKVVYGMVYDGNGNISNDGCYYYIDNHDYIKDFCKYIKQFYVSNEYELFDYILDFLKGYFGCIEKISREDMFKLIKNDQGHNFDLTKEHGLSQFKGKGNALCTEYSVMAQNILSVFGITSYLTIGKIKTGDKEAESHAFNLISLPHDKDILVDFSNYVKIYDLDFEYLGDSPFIGNVGLIDQEFVNRLVNDEEVLEFEDYSYLIVGDTLAKISYDRNRSYFIDGEIYYGHSKKKCK